jgi:SAM-dependent methyltransferase
MPDVDLYDSHYAHVEADVYRAIRAETYGEDLGQTSWMTASEFDGFCGWLALDRSSRFLEVACGSGGAAVRVAERFGASVTGVDVNPAAIGDATARAHAHGVEERAQFEVADGDRALPFSDASFDALFCNDAILHLRERGRVLLDWARVLRPGGRCLYTDGVVVTGCVTNEELRIRSSIGFFLFTPIGANEKFLEDAGFRTVRVEDATDSMSRISGRWRDARARREDLLRRFEGDAKYEDLQRFLSMVHTVASERRLSRFAFLAERR